jgi:transcriptional regulator with XRE-family HTH domain
MAKGNEIGERIEKLRRSQGLTQVAFAESIGVSQGRLSEWESGASTPSAEGYVKLAAQAAKSDDSEAFFFWKQSGVVPDALASLARVLLEKREIEMGAILAAAENVLKGRVVDAKSLEEKGTVILVPPFTEGRWKTQESMAPEPVAAWRVPNKGSTYFIAPDPARGAVRIGGGPWDTIVFDSSEKSLALIGEEVLVDSGKGLCVGRLVWTSEHPTPRLALAPAYDPPGNWNPTMLDSPHAPMQRFAGEILGRVIARFPGQPDSYWRRLAGLSAPKR